MRIRTILTTTALTIATTLLVAGTATAAPGPSYDTVDALDGWLCGGQLDADGAMVTPPDPGAPVPPNHCINARSRGATGVILVFPPDDRGPSEGISSDPRSDDRPCPHDPGSDDGTWWQPTGPDGNPLPFWVCHHRP